MPKKDALIDYWLKNKIITDQRLIKAFQEVKRENFITKEFINEAYGDYPLPIGHEQTISQPTTIMLMTEALELKSTDKVLEIGSGSGYQAVLISKLAKKVVSIEIIKDLVLFAKENIKNSDIKNVEIIHGDGSNGYEKSAPYDKIIVTAACPKIPEALIEQLKDNGIIVAPVGPLYGQVMVKARKIKNQLITEKLGDFMFVPLKGKYGY